MELKNIDMIDRVAVLSKFGDMHLPQKISYAIMRNTTILKKEMEIYQKSLDVIMDKYSEWFVKDENGKNVILPSGVPTLFLLSLLSLLQLH